MSKHWLPTLNKQMLNGQSVWALHATSEQTGKNAALTLFIRHGYELPDGSDTFTVVLYETGDEHVVLPDIEYAQTVKDIMEHENMDEESASDAAWAIYRPLSAVRVLFDADVASVIEDLKARWNAIKLLVEPSVTM